MIPERQAINELNKVVIRAVGTNLPADPADAPEPRRAAGAPVIFTAYLTGPVDLGSKNKFGDFEIPGIPGLGKLGQELVVVGINSLGKVAAFDIPRMLSYRGSEPISFTISCSLKLDNDPNVDFMRPVHTLAALTYPKQAGKVVDALHGKGMGGEPASVAPSASQDVVDDSWAGKIGHGVASGLSWAVGGLYDLAVGSLKSWLSDFAPVQRIVGVLEDTYFLDIPVSQREGVICSVEIGTPDRATFVLDDIILAGFSVSIPRLIYDVGYPDRLELKIQIESRRMAKSDTFANFMPSNSMKPMQSKKAAQLATPAQEPPKLRT